MVADFVPMQSDECYPGAMVRLRKNVVRKSLTSIATKVNTKHVGARPLSQPLTYLQISIVNGRHVKVSSKSRHSHSGKKELGKVCWREEGSSRHSSERQVALSRPVCFAHYLNHSSNGMISHGELNVRKMICTTSLVDVANAAICERHFRFL